MATADLDTGTAAPDRLRRSAPVARVSLGTLVRNARIALAASPAIPAAVLDLRGDARGHGVLRVTGPLLQAGVALVRVSEQVVAELASLVPADRVSRSATPTLDTDTVFGLPGAMPGARPALRLDGTVLSVKTLRAGEGVSYGYAHRARHDTRIALVTGGYAQGIVRALGGRLDVRIGDMRRPVVGRVAMDVCVVDIGDAPVSRGERVVFLGDPDAGEPSLAEWMASTGLTASELVTAVGMHAVREHVA